ncbi:MAG: hypothetical protein ACREVO_19590 [Steroidobacteraceae bacterium]
MAAFDLAAQGMVEGTAPGRLLIRFWAVALVALVALVAACSRGPQHPDWVIHSAIEVIGAPPAGGYRLIFPYVVGDVYGAANTGAFVVPMSLTPRSFTLDLNRTQQDLQSELGPTDFELHRMKIAPRDARLARLAPVALQRDGIEAVGSMDWRDAHSGRSLMLVYVDRPAWITGTFSRVGATFRYNIRVPKPGYVWIAAIRAGEHATLYAVVPPPRDLILTITTGQK